MVLVIIFLSACGDTDVRPERRRVGALLDSVSGIRTNTRTIHRNLDKARKLLNHADSLLSVGNDLRARKLVAQAEIDIRIAVVRLEGTSSPPDSSRETGNGETTH
jgi:hypothetical protein